MPDGTRIEYRPDGTPLRQWNPDGSTVVFDRHGRPVSGTTAKGAPVHYPPEPTVARLLANPRPLPIGRDAPGAPAVRTGRKGADERMPPTVDGPPLGAPLPAAALDGPEGVSAAAARRPVPQGGAPADVGVPLLPGGALLQGADGSDPSAVAGTRGGDPLITRSAMTGGSTQREDSRPVAPSALPGAPVPPVPFVSPDGVVGPDGVALRGADVDGGGPGPRPGGLPASPALPLVDQMPLVGPASGDPAGGGPADRFADGPAGGPTAGPTARSNPGGPPVTQVPPNAVAFAGFDGSLPPNETAGGDRSVVTNPSGDPATFMLRTAPVPADQPAPSTDPHDVPMTLRVGAASAAGAGGGPVEKVAPDGTVFTNFDASGRPTQGRASDGTPFTLAYDDKGDVIEHFPDGSSVTYDPQGHPLSMVSPNGDKVTFAVDIPALGAAANAVSALHDAMSATIDLLKQLFVKIEGEWKGPAGKRFAEITTTFNSVTDNLSGLLGEAVDRMRSSYHNYMSTEQTNSNNLH